MTTETTRPDTLPPATARGFDGLRCPLCGDVESVQQLHLDDLDGVTCTACGEDYSLGDVRDMVTAWSRVLAWVDLAAAR